MWSLHASNSSAARTAEPDRIAPLGREGLLEGIKAVVFDLDDTLINTLSAAYDAACRTAVRFSRPQPRYDVFVETYGNSFESMAFRWFPDDENVRPAALRAEFVRQGEKNGFSAFFDVNRLIKRLQEAGYKVLLWTDSGESRTDSKCLGAGINKDLFDAIVTRDSPEGGLKPDPDAIQAELVKLGIDSSQAVMVGNSTMDQHAARLVGMHFCAVGYLEPWAEALEPASYHLDSALQIESLLGKGSA